MKSRHNRTPPQNRMLQLYWGLLLLFLGHRAFTFRHLDDHLMPTWSHWASSLLIGFLSDYWVAFLGSLLFLPLALVHRWGSFWVLLLFTALLLAHYPYVEFFHATFHPSHFEYLTDPLFLKANSSAVLSWQTGAQAAVYLAIAIWIHRRPFPMKSSWRSVGIGCFLALSGLAAHAFQIYYREAWHIPQQLRSHFIEATVINWRYQRLLEPWDSPGNELAELNQALQKQEEPVTAAQLVTTQLPVPLDPLTAQIQQAWRQSRDQRQQPLMLLVLLESWRSADFDLSNSWSRSLQPHLSELASTGVFFPSVHTSSHVTRGGQEAVWCGFLSHAGNSMMRNRPDIKRSCLPQLAKRHAAPHLFWYHNGEGRFDNQLSFWRQQGVTDYLTQNDFAINSPGTGWGVSDRLLMTESLKRLAQRPDAAYSLGMILSVTNHSPWSLPQDAPASIPSHLLKDRHPSATTLWYTDSAVQLLVQGLKTNRLWDSTLLLVLGDHGNAIDPLVPGTTMSLEQRLSTTPFILTGGLLNKALPEDSQHSPPQWVSQLDVATFMAQVLELPLESMGEGLWSPKTRPIASDFADRVYFPQIDRTFPIKEVLKYQGQYRHTQPEWHHHLLYYRATLLAGEIWARDQAPIKPSSLHEP